MAIVCERIFGDLLVMESLPMRQEDTPACATLPDEVKQHVGNLILGTFGEILDGIWHALHVCESLRFGRVRLHLHAHRHSVTRFVRREGRPALILSG